MFLKSRGKKVGDSKRPNPLNWGEEEVLNWLVTICQLPEYCHLFHEKSVNGADLIVLSEVDLKEMGIELIGHRKLILYERALLKENCRSLKERKLSCTTLTTKPLVDKVKEKNERSSSAPSLLEVESTSDNDECLSLNGPLPTLPPNPLEWSKKDVGLWLDSIGLGSFKEKFKVELISGDVLFELDSAILLELGMKIAEVTKFVRERSRLEGRVPQDNSAHKNFLTRVSYPPEAPEEVILGEEGPSRWNVERVCKWVEEVGMEQYSANFLKNVVDGPALLSIDKINLKYVGVNNLGHAKKRSSFKFKN